MRHYSTADGALLGDILAAAQDRDGALWFGFVTGPVRLVPQPDSPQPSPPILLTGLRISGNIYPISALGEAQLGPLQIGPERNDLQVDFVALGFGSGEDLKYQYKLEGATQDWSPLTAQRALNFANLGPGSYRLLVRAVGADGAASETPASFSFSISCRRCGSGGGSSLLSLRWPARWLTASTAFESRSFSRLSV
jgi:hypothetical protein